MINPDIYRKSNGIISFKYITDDVKYDNKFLIKILDVLLVDNLIKNWKNDIKIINDNKNLLSYLTSVYVNYILIDYNLHKLNDGLYNYIITYDNKSFNEVNKSSFKIHFIKILPYEISTKHMNLLTKIYQNDTKLNLLCAGECKIYDNNIYYNFKSGHIMRKIMKKSFINITNHTDLSNNRVFNKHIKYWWQPLISHIFDELLPKKYNTYITKKLF